MILCCCSSRMISYMAFMAEVQTLLWFEPPASVDSTAIEMNGNSKLILQVLFTSLVIIYCLAKLKLIEQSRSHRFPHKFPRRNVHRTVTEVSGCFICLFCHTQFSSTVPAIINSSVCWVHGQTHMAFKLSCSFKPTPSSCEIWISFSAPGFDQSRACWAHCMRKVKMRCVL